MVFFLLLAGAAVNAVLCIIGGVIIIVGIVFYLIGLPQSKRTEKSKIRDMIHYSLPILTTLLMIILYMVITYWCARTEGTLAFSRSVPADVELLQAKKLVFWGILQGVYSLVAFKWLLPGLIGELGLNRRQKWWISFGAIITVAGGGAVWLTSAM
ncbi:hypothetical protein [Paenibacillus sp. DYY-L-2]|uniref:hypothetical protein n=1 Tax=Paenibacillus sp. DYY-L-2 TaxID=3447013 RepID=UPI003F4F79C6